jgi:hypothetical protein|nr:MAG TPA: hypothetical protein [Caudoviricetes sp.]
MKNRRNDEWIDEFAYKIALSAPCVCMGTLAAIVWAVILKLLNSMVFKIIVSIPGHPAGIHCHSLIRDMERRFWRQ